MRIEPTRRGDYAVRAMLALAGANGELLAARQIAESMAIPASFLPQVMTDLVHARLVLRRMGRRGGYQLAKPADDISLLSIIEAVEGDGRRRTCVLRGGPCGEPQTSPCPVHEYFFAAQQALSDALSSVTLAAPAAKLFDAPKRHSRNTPGVA